MFSRINLLGKNSRGRCACNEAAHNSKPGCIAPRVRKTRRLSSIFSFSETVSPSTYQVQTVLHGFPKPLCSAMPKPWAEATQEHPGTI